MTQMTKTDQQCMKWLEMKSNETKNRKKIVLRKFSSFVRSENIPEMVHQNWHIYIGESNVTLSGW